MEVRGKADCLMGEYTADQSPVTAARLQAFVEGELEGAHGKTSLLSQPVHALS